MSEKRWTRAMSEGGPERSATDMAIEVGAALLGKAPGEFEHLRQFDTPEKIDAEIARLEAERASCGTYEQ